MPDRPVIASRLVLYALLAAIAGPATAQTPAQPVFLDGQAQVVPAFADPADWIRHDLWWRQSSTRMGTASRTGSTSR